MLLDKNIKDIKETSKIINVILCGGSGTRLWPLSNNKQPKQLLQIFDGKSLLQLSAERNYNFTDSILAVSSESQGLEVKKQLEQDSIDKKINILTEPIGRNTAAAIALAAFTQNPDDILLVTPADHLIGTPDLYKSAIEQAISFASEGSLVTLGLTPLYPETGYGYIQYQGNNVIRFAEKPDKVLAEAFFNAGDYLWNSGVFCFKAGVILEELKKYAQEIYTSAKNAYEYWKSEGNIPLDYMLKIPSTSIDYAVMEKSKIVKVISTEMEWSDVGSYEALADALSNKYHHHNNQLVPIGSEKTNNFLIGNKQTVAILGIEDLIVVNTDDTLLIIKKGHGQDVKKVHEWIKENKPQLL